MPIPISQGLALLLAVGVGVAPADADQFSRSGARGTAQAGALSARAPDTSALIYNPAALVHLLGVHVELGAALDISSDRYTRDGRSETSRDPMHAPPSLYVSWRPGSRWALGMALDQPVAYRHNQPGSGLSSTPFTPDLDIRLIQLHPVAAFAIGHRWSVGGGVRYIRGRIRDVYDTTLDSGRNPNTFWTVGRRSAESDVDAWATDASLSFRDLRWGFGMAIASGAQLQGTADVDIAVQHHGLPGAPRAAASLAYLMGAPRDLGANLAPEMRGGFWTAPHRALTMEADVVLVRWSAADWVRPRELPLCGSPCSTLLPRNGRDTVSLRLGTEFVVSPRIHLAGGLAYEPSPESRTTPLPSGFSASQRGAWTYSAGTVVDLSTMAIDVGYASQTRNSMLTAGVNSRAEHSSRSQTFAISTRWRF